MKLFDKIKLPFFLTIYAILGSLSGSQNSFKIYRRILIPIITMLYAYIIISKQIGYIQSLWLITILSMIGSLSIGYGIPDDGYETNPNLDKGSYLGNLMYRIFHKNRVLANVFTRMTVGLALCINLLAIPLLTAKYGVYLIGCLSILIGQSYFSWQSWRSYDFTWKNKQYNLLYSDMLNYGCLGLGIWIMVR